MGRRCKHLQDQIYGCMGVTREHSVHTERAVIVFLMWAISQQSLVVDHKVELV
jgi:hypothetical protein